MGSESDRATKRRGVHGKSVDSASSAKEGEYPQRVTLNPMGLAARLCYTPCLRRSIGLLRQPLASPRRDTLQTRPRFIFYQPPTLFALPVAAVVLQPVVSALSLTTPTSSYLRRFSYTSCLATADSFPFDAPLYPCAQEFHLTG